jgi:hypothetical protein
MRQYFFRKEAFLAYSSLMPQDIYVDFPLLKDYLPVTSQSEKYT